MFLIDRYYYIDIDDYNSRRYRELGLNASFKCTSCEKMWSYYQCHSHKGYNCVCEECIEKIARVTGTTRDFIIERVMKTGLYYYNEKEGDK